MSTGIGAVCDALAMPVRPISADFMFIATHPTLPTVVTYLANHHLKE